jgi:hypothetical protein
LHINLLQFYNRSTQFIVQPNLVITSFPRRRFGYIDASFLVVSLIRDWWYHRWHKWFIRIEVRFICSGDTIGIMWDFRFSRRRVWSSEYSGMYCRVLNWISTDVSEVHAASIITGYITSDPFALGSFIALMMEAARITETSVDIQLRTQQWLRLAVSKWPHRVGAIPFPHTFFTWRRKQSQSPKRF